MRRWRRSGRFPSSFRRAAGSTTPRRCRWKSSRRRATAVSPESQSDEDLKLLAINSLMNSEPERAVPLLEKVLNDPKNNLGSEVAGAVCAGAEPRAIRRATIVAQYAKSGAIRICRLRAVSIWEPSARKASQQALADIYAANNDVSVRRAVLRSMVISRDAAHLVCVPPRARRMPDLRREAIRDLGDDAGGQRAQPALCERDRTRS